MECFKCGKVNLPSSSFCINCGNQLKGDKIDAKEVNKKYFIQSAVLFLCLVLIVIISLKLNDHLTFYTYEYLFTGLLALVTIIFVSLDVKSFLKVFRKPYKIKPFVQILVGAPVVALIVIYLAHYINLFFGLTTPKYYEVYGTFTPNTYMYGFFFVAILPGFIEEFLFRGILFNYLIKLTSPKLTILITTILFAFIHFSFLSIIWLFTIGLYLGYLRFRYRTIWYGILFHVLYNGSIYFLEIIIDKI